MNTNKMLAWGSALATLGGLGIILLLILDWSSLSRAWSFAVGFGFGLPAGVGTALAIFGLLARRREQP